MTDIDLETTKLTGSIIYVGTVLAAFTGVIWRASGIIKKHATKVDDLREAILTVAEESWSRKDQRRYMHEFDRANRGKGIHVPPVPESEIERPLQERI